MDEKCVADCYVIDVACGSSSSSSSGSKRKKVLLQVVSKKLQVLEEEASMMRKSMVVCMNERREIITQISHLFQTIQSHSSVLQTKQPLPLCLEKRQNKVGLLQALSEDSNPSLVLRGPMAISPADAVACLDYG